MVTLITIIEDEELLFLMAHDTDSFNKWNAGNRYYTKLILTLAEGSQPDLPAGDINRLGRKTSFSPILL